MKSRLSAPDDPFAHVIESLENEGVDGFRVQPRPAVVALQQGSPYAGPSESRRAYADVQQARPNPCLRGAMAPSPDLSRIAECRNAGDLRELRRRFALEFHPDRKDKAERDAAAAAMSLINARIDARIAELTAEERA